MNSVKSDWPFFWFLKALTVAALASAGTLPAFCAASATTIDFQPDPQPAPPTATPGAGVDWVSFAMLATLVGGIVLLVLWQLWLYFFPAFGRHTRAATGSTMTFRITGADARSGKDRTIEVEAASEKEAVAIARGQGVFTHNLNRGSSPALRERLNQSQDTDVYIKSNCRLCGGSIEFPEHGLGESVGCPHCNEQIELRRLDAAERLLLGVRVWCREQSFNWKWGAGVIAVLIMCGTALFIYRDYKAEWRKHEEQRAKQEQERIALQQQQLEELQEANQELQDANQLAAERAERERLDAISKPVDRNDFFEKRRQQQALDNNRNDFFEKRRQQQALDNIEFELQRANDLAEQAAFQRRLDELRRPTVDMMEPAYSPALSSPQVVAPPLGSSVTSYDPNSLANPYGAGSPYKPDGLMNPYSQYGSPYSPKSWRNPYATDTPRLYDGHGNYRGKLSSNPYDLDSISNPYGRYGSPYSADSIKNPYGAGNPYLNQPIYVVPPR